MKKIIILFALFTLFLVSCGDEEKTDEQIDSAKASTENTEKPVPVIPPTNNNQELQSPEAADPVTPVTSDEPGEPGLFDAEKVFNEYLKVAGQNKMSTIKTIKSSGKISQNNMESNFVRIQKKPDKIYLEMESQGQKMIQSFNGKKAWAYMPTMGPEPQEITGQQLEMIRMQASTDMFIQDWKKLGINLKAVGIEMLNGKKVYNIRASNEGGEDTYLFIDFNSKLLLMMRTTVSMQQNKMTAETYFKNYKAVKGIKIPFLIENTANGVVMSKFTIEKFELDINLDDAVFGKPNVK